MHGRWQKAKTKHDQTRQNKATLDPAGGETEQCIAAIHVAACCAEHLHVLVDVPIRQYNKTWSCRGRNQAVYHALGCFGARRGFAIFEEKLQQSLCKYYVHVSDKKNQKTQANLRLFHPIACTQLMLISLTKMSATKIHDKKLKPSMFWAQPGVKPSIWYCTWGWQNGPQAGKKLLLYYHNCRYYCSNYLTMWF